MRGASEGRNRLPDERYGTPTKRRWCYTASSRGPQHFVAVLPTHRTSWPIGLLSFRGIRRFFVVRNRPLCDWILLSYYNLHRTISLRRQRCRLKTVRFLFVFSHFLSHYFLFDNRPTGKTPTAAMEVDKDGPVLKMGSGYELRFEDEPELEETYKERAENDLGETPERRAEALEEFRRLIRGKKRLARREWPKANYWQETGGFWKKNILKE